MQYLERLRGWLNEVAQVPWLHALRTLRERFREDRLGLTASSLTFTTTIALVPFITVALAVFTAFPMFAKFQDVLQKWLIESLVPDNIARQVLGYLNQFAGKASKLGVVGLAVLLGTARRWCSPLTVRSTTFGACAAPDRLRSACSSIGRSSRWGRCCWL